MFNCAMMTQSIFLICVLVCNSVALSSSWQTIVIKRSPTNYKKLIRNFGTRQSEDYILRVCSGPACSNFNPSFTYSRLQSELTEIPDLKVWSLYSSRNEKHDQTYFHIVLPTIYLIRQIKTIDCLSACKRGCNVALIRKGECAGIPDSQ